MGTQEASIVPFKANQQAFEFVHPRKGAFRTEASRIDRRIEQALAPAFSLLAIARVLRDVGNQTMIETGLARLAGVKRHIRIEICAF